MKPHTIQALLLTTILLDILKSTDAFNCGTAEYTVISALELFFSPENGQLVQEQIDCTYKIHANDASKIVIATFEKFLIKRSVDCENNFVKVWDGEKTDNILLSFKCGDDIPGQVNSTKTFLTIQYKVDSQAVGEGFKIVYEQATAPKMAGCGRTELFIFPKNATFTSTGQGNHIPIPIDCLYTITAGGENTVPKLVFEKFNIKKSPDCTEGYVKIWNEEPTDTNLISKKCGDDNPDEVMSATKTMFLQYKVNSQALGEGYKMTLVEVQNPTKADCGPLTLRATSEEQTFRSYGQGNLISYQIDCTYTITASDNNMVVSMQFDQFKIQETENCAESYVKIYNGEDTPDNLLMTVCGIQSPGNVESTKPAIIIKYKAGYQSLNGGFKAQVKQVQQVTIQCGQTLTIAAGSTINVNAYKGDPYFVQNKLCLIPIQTSPAHWLELEFLIFRFAGTNGSCSDTDYLQIGNGLQPQPDAPKLCGTKNLNRFASSSYTMFINYLATNDQNTKGFRATVKSVQEKDIPCNIKLNIVAASTANITAYEGDPRFIRGVSCLILIATKAGYKLELAFIKFQFKGTNGNCADTDYMQMGNGLQLQSDAAKMCGPTAPDPFVSSENAVFLNYIATDVQDSKGFIVTVKSVPETPIVCNETVTIEAGSTKNIIAYEDYPQFVTDKICLIPIETSAHYKLELTFTKFQFKGTNGSCAETDYLQMGNGLELQSDAAKMCGPTAPDPFVSSDSAMFINYIATDLQNTKGFMATVKSVSSAGYTRFSTYLLIVLAIYSFTAM